MYTRYKKSTKSKITFPIPRCVEDQNFKNRGPIPFFSVLLGHEVEPGSTSANTQFGVCTVEEVDAVVSSKNLGST